MNDDFERGKREGVAAYMRIEAKIKKWPWGIIKLVLFGLLGYAAGYAAGVRVVCP